MPTKEYEWIIMDSYDVLRQLEKYKDCEGNTYRRGDTEFKCLKVLAAPRNLAVFSKRHEKYLKSCRQEVFSGVDKEYTLYFFNSKTKKPKFFLRLDDFVKDCLNGKRL